ncbi:UNVERIFIED_CONTAM: hypothetical protein GTU68_029184 [Idotea baltica]|nr:hypothetical protein [Idotea baltica]
MVGSNGKLPKDENFIFYNNLKSPDGAVEHTGDVLEASGEGDDEETLLVTLDNVDPSVEELIFVVTIHEADGSMNFGQVRDAYIRVLNQENNEEMMKYELSEDFSIETAVTIGRFYRREGGWRFEAMGIGIKGGLGEYLAVYN